jgi:ABC-type multidrug transport system ATPase subunit/ABC-type multidrug transport system permease subunit
MIAIMGPSGCGKTTLLNHLAFRNSSGKAQSQTRICVDETPITPQQAKSSLRYVESDDVLIGSLTVRETLTYTARFSLPDRATKQDRQDCVERLLRMFGLEQQADTIVGTIARKCISTGQKRRLSIASQMAFAPDILLLDEPTSGLDSAASFGVMSYIRDLAKSQNLIVVCSVHQPSTTTFELFDKLLLLSEGKTCYFGAVDHVRPYFDDLGYKMGLYINPAEFVLDLVNVEFAREKDRACDTLVKIQEAWAQRERERISTSDEKGVAPLSLSPTYSIRTVQLRVAFRKVLAVLHRSWIKSHRDILVYWVRFGMYMGLSIMMGTVWLRLSPSQSNIQAYANCILFGSAFMSFMAVVYVPAFVEDRLVYIKDRDNGMYGSGAFMIANFIVGLPYLFLVALCTSAFTYWMVNFRPAGDAFMMWTLWMYLNLLAAESLVVFIASLVPNFVGALALGAMTNGIWMACNGFMVAPNRLNPFWHYVFYYINYQAYVFRGLITNEFAYRSYDCNAECYCQFNTVLANQCQIQGSGILQQQYEFEGGSQELWIGITIGIIAALRLFGWVAMEFRR